MSEPPVVPPPRPALIDRAEQVVLVLALLAVMAGLGWRAIGHYRIGAEPLEVLSPADGPTYRVNVNQADWVTLTLVPGLGETLAKRIVEHRDRCGGQFASLDQLQGVNGISDKILAKLERYLDLADPDTDDHPIQMIEGH